MTNTYNITYGSDYTEDQVYTYTDRNGGTWYTVDGSTNVNYTYDEIKDNTHVEDLSDHDSFSWSSEITSEEELSQAVEG